MKLIVDNRFIWSTDLTNSNTEISTKKFLILSYFLYFYFLYRCLNKNSIYTMEINNGVGSIGLSEHHKEVIKVHDNTVL